MDTCPPGRPHGCSFPLFPPTQDLAPVISGLAAKIAILTRRLHPEQPPRLLSNALELANNDMTASRLRLTRSAKSTSCMHMACTNSSARAVHTLGRCRGSSRQKRTRATSEHCAHPVVGHLHQQCPHEWLLSREETLSQVHTGNIIKNAVPKGTGKPLSMGTCHILSQSLNAPNLHLQAQQSKGQTISLSHDTLPTIRRDPVPHAYLEHSTAQLLRRAPVTNPHYGIGREHQRLAHTQLHDLRK